MAPCHGVVPNKSVCKRGLWFGGLNRVAEAGEKEKKEKEKLDEALKEVWDLQ